MQPFRVHKGLAVPLDRVNVDTDQIIPKQFLKRIERTGFGKFLFYDWRYSPEGKPNSDFVLNQPRYQRASVLIAAKNFGCGSSREHAPWALADYGIRAIVAPSFADIFAHNSFKNGLLTVTLPDPEINKLMRRAKEVEGYQVTVDLEAGHVYDDMGLHAAFEFDHHKRRCLLEGLDEIGLTLEQEAAIAAYEAKRSGR
ncbi:MAG TPA: 3-isopropylmalate dehydratase small subunit [Terriglobales bacterium]|nr:3-isopropylmalate dehydratase small subunit [Terriglobales bacterium]